MRFIKLKPLTDNFTVSHSLFSVSATGHAGSSLEISNTVDIRSEVNRELVMRLVSDVASGNRFYTDLNSFQVHPLFDDSNISDVTC